MALSLQIETLKAEKLDQATKLHQKSSDIHSLNLKNDESISIIQLKQEELATSAKQILDLKEIKESLLVKLGFLENMLDEKD